MKASEVTKGMRFGRLVTVEISETLNSREGARWICQCDCGNMKTVPVYRLMSGNTKSCGCIKREMLQQRNYRHGQSRTPLHTHWCGMKSRCNNPHSQFYYCYGGKGVKVCDEWQNDFNAFYKWSMENGYKEGLTLDRIDYNGDYSPDNCRWTTWKTQMNNYSLNHIIEYKGEQFTIAEAAERFNIPYNTLKQRVNMLHWDIEKAIETPVRSVRHHFHYDGKDYNGEQLSVLFGYCPTYAGQIMKRFGFTEGETVNYLINKRRNVSNG